MSALRRTLAAHFWILAATVGVLWLLELADLLFWRGQLDALGIQPRTQAGLRHLFIAPLLHRGLGHLMANTAPLVVLGWLVLWRGIRAFLLVTGMAALVSGLGIWLFGSPYTIHLGASGVIFGYLGFLLGQGYLERRGWAVALAVGVLIVYGGMLWGLLPLRTGISWQGHLFGFVGGGMAAYWLAGQGEG